MQKMISYLSQNPEVVELVKNGSASLVGVSQAEQQAIVEVFSGREAVPLVKWL